MWVRRIDPSPIMTEHVVLSLLQSSLCIHVVLLLDVDPRPPPIIHQGPQNQTLPVSTVAMLQCHSSGRPPPTIRWFKDNQLITHDDHITQLSSGTLQISALRNSDTGMYTCKAVSETGETSWSAALNVEGENGGKNILLSACRCIILGDNAVNEPVLLICFV